MTLGNNIYQLRTKAGLSQEELAEQTGVSRQSVSKWETDASIPELDKLIQLSKLFGVTLDSLVQDEDEQPDGADAVPTGAAPSAHPPQSTLTPRRIIGIILFTLGLIGVFVSLFLLNDIIVGDTAAVVLVFFSFSVPCGLWCIFAKKHFLPVLIGMIVVCVIVTIIVLSVLNAPQQFENISVALP